MHIATPAFPSPTERPSLLRVALAGTAADLGATVVAFAFLLGFSLIGSLVSAIGSGTSPRRDAFIQARAFLGLSIIVGAAGSLLGGFVAGRLYSARPCTVGLLVGLGACLSALVLAPFIREPSPVQASEITAFGLALVASVVGAFLGSKRPVSISGSA